MLSGHQQSELKTSKTPLTIRTALGGAVRETNTKAVLSGIHRILKIFPAERNPPKPVVTIF